MGRKASGWYPWEVNASPRKVSALTLAAFPGENVPGLSACERWQQGGGQEEESLWVNADLSIWQGNPGIRYPTDLLCVVFILVSDAHLIANLTLTGIKS